MHAAGQFWMPVFQPHAKLNQRATFQFKIQLVGSAVQVDAVEYQTPEAKYAVLFIEHI